MKKIRTLVVDDEPLARARIVNLLRKQDDIALLGECKNGHEALEKIVNYKPDLVFLDIQMPDLNGFDVLSKMPADELPFIIFVTAYDQYALKAFDVHAVDYLLKPYDDDRFIKALNHAKEQIWQRQKAGLHQKMVQLISGYEKDHSELLTSLEIKDKGRTFYVNVLDLYYIESHGNYIKIYLKDKSYLVRQTLQSLEDQIDQSVFLRIHRSILINSNYLIKVKYEGNNQYLFLLKNESQLLSSRSYKAQILDFLGDDL